MMKCLELSFEEYLEMCDYVILKGVEIFLIFFDEELLEFLIFIDMLIYKILLGEIINLFYLEKIGK